MSAKRTKLIIAVVIILLTALISYITGEGLILLFWNLILALFPSEIKNFVRRIPNMRSVRVSYSYLFRIEMDGHYLLVRDEQGRNDYHPVGGVYKYDPDSIDMAERFDGTYDGVFNTTSDTKDDLRLVICKQKLQQFQSWFSSRQNRENICDLSREFREELIERNILDGRLFKKIKYKYIGSFTQKSYNEKLRMLQIRHYDVVNLKVTKPQRLHLETLLHKTSEQYVFVSKDDIKNRTLDFNGHHYTIAEHTDLILIGNKNLVEELNKDTFYTVTFSGSFAKSEEQPSLSYN